MTNQPASAEDQAFNACPAWMHESQIRSLQTQLDADIRQRAALVQWIADLDVRISRAAIQIHRHQEALK